MSKYTAETEKANPVLTNIEVNEKNNFRSSSSITVEMRRNRTMILFCLLLAKHELLLVVLELDLSVNV